MQRLILSLLAIDAGNTRIKWAVKEKDAWIKHGFCLKDEESQELSELVTQVNQVAVSNVGKQEQSDYLASILQNINPIWIKVQDKFKNISINYAPISSLGVDRYCALIALQDYYGAGIVIMAGTAITIDYLPDTGEYTGGLILPGRNMMLDAITNNTNIQLDSSIFEPDNTSKKSTAISVKEGIEAAIAGAYSLYNSNSNINSKQVVISGGDAKWLAKYIPNATVDTDLIFKGIELSAVSN